GAALVARAEEMESQTRNVDVAFALGGERREERAQRVDAGWQQRADVRNVHEVVASEPRTARHEFQIATVPADWQLAGGARPGGGGTGERLLVRGMRHRRHSVSGGKRDRLDARGDPPAQAALEIRAAAGRRADRASPFADPRILVVKNERDAETPLQLRSEQG